MIPVNMARVDLHEERMRLRLALDNLPNPDRWGGSTFGLRHQMEERLQELDDEAETRARGFRT